jgi:multicomponent K+:H+ antiporter subunit D
MSHLPVIPVLLPLLVGALLLIVEKRGIALQRGIAFASTALLVAVAVALVVRADSGQIDIYLLGNWPAHLGIALTVDRLSALLVLTTALLALACVIHASAGWDRKAPHFHALFQFQLAGIGGAFLTGDLFNLFVFFEVLLIASYGLLLSGGRGPRTRAGVHYVAFNITASTLFLVAVGLLYGLTGALNMAEMAQRIAAAPAENRALIQAAGGVLIVVFCAKAALLPLYLWLPETYSRTPAPVAALFAIMTKVGVYAILRVYTLVFGSTAGDMAGFAWDWLLPAAAITLVLASFGALAARHLRGLTAYLVVASAATLFIAFAMQSGAAIGAGLYYLVQSTFVAGALFLLADLIRHQRGAAGDSLAASAGLGQRALLGSLFVIAAVAVAGLPPLSGFIAKFGILAAIPNAQAAWLWPLVLVTSLLAIVALARAGGHLFWESPAPEPGAPAVSRRGVAATGLLLGLVVAMSLGAGPALRYTTASGEQLLSPLAYRSATQQAPVVPAWHAPATDAVNQEASP